jgi:hypothetical protein
MMSDVLASIAVTALSTDMSMADSQPTNATQQLNLHIGLATCGRTCGQRKSAHNDNDNATDCQEVHALLRALHALLRALHALLQAPLAVFQAAKRPSLSFKLAAKRPSMSLALAMMRTSLSFARAVMRSSLSLA